MQIINLYLKKKKDSEHACGVSCSSSILKGLNDVQLN